MKSRPELIELSKVANEKDTTSEGFYSKELFALNVQIKILEVYRTPPLKYTDALEVSNHGWTKFQLKQSREGKLSELMVHLLSYTNKIGATEMTTSNEYEHAEKGLIHCVKDLNCCLITAYDKKLGIRFCQDVIGYIEHFCKTEKIDIWNYVHILLDIENTFTDEN
jgi:hypothetical protein